jgi:multidrug efflux pump subunit AcrA (membrane-fusion protein)
MNREYAVITAPADGVVLTRSVNGGAQVAPGTQVLLLASAARGNVLRAGLADRDAVRVKLGDAATATFDAYPGREFRGRVRQVGAAADARSGTYTIDVALEGTAALPSGLVGRVTVASESGRGTSARGIGDSRTGGADAGLRLLSIPAEALVEGNAQRGVVYAVDASGRLALRREVTLVSVDGDRVLVRGLDGAKSVVTAGAAWLHDSARVEIKP